MDAHQIALIMLGRVDQDLTDVATPSVDEVANEIIAISDETRNLRVRTGLKYDFAYAVVVSIREAGHLIKIEPVVRGRKQQERECRLAVLETATDHILADYTVWDKIPDLGESLYIASKIQHLELAFDISRERILDWYIRYLIRADCIRGEEWPRDYGNGGASRRWGLTQAEKEYCDIAYGSSDHQRKYLRSHLRCLDPYYVWYIFDWWGILEREHNIRVRDGSDLQSDFEMLEWQQASDVEREYERRVCIRMLPDLGVILDLARIAASYC